MFAKALTSDKAGKPNSGRNLGQQEPGDVLVVFEHEDIFGWRAMHYAPYQGNGIIYDKNGNSDVHVARLPDYLKNCPNAIIRVFQILRCFPRTGPCLLK